MQNMRNDLESRLAAMHAGQLDADVFRGLLLGVQESMPIEDSGHGLDLEPDTVTRLAALATSNCGH